MEISLEEIQKKFESLPEDLKWSIMAANVDDNIIEIGQKENLNVEQMGQLSLETHMVMFGFTHPDKFEESVRNSLKLPEEKIHTIVNDVNEKILKEIREKLIDSSKIKEEENDTEILKSAGIEIVPEKLEIDSPHPILAQKLSGLVKNPVVETDHSIENITKEEKTSGNRADVPKIDPYREIPE
ncbi:MAG: hypothetical protein WA060_01200 [Minisyncoccia bacterium]